MNSRPSTFKYQSCQYCINSLHAASNKIRTHTLCIAHTTKPNWEQVPLNYVCDLFEPTKEANRYIKLNQL